METILCNFSGPVRRHVMQGRKYLVAPITFFVEGVLEGSDGPGFYSGEQITANVDDWNGIPLVVYHPLIEGKPFTARHPLIADTSEVGRVFNALSDKTNNGLHRTGGEAWFDEELTKKVDPRVHYSLSNNLPLEVSTGLKLKREYVANGAIFTLPDNTQKPYKWQAKNLKPDHVAVLPDQVGACSIKDGCGVLINKHTGDLLPTVTVTDINNPIHTGDPDVNKTQLVEYITTNCDCWKKPADKETLNKLDEAKLNEIKAGIDKAKAEKEKADRYETVVNAAKKGFTDPGGNTHIYNDKTNQWETKPKTPETPITVNTGTGSDTVTTNTFKKPANTQEWLALMPPEAQSTWNHAVEIENREKLDIVSKLTVNVTDANRKQALSQYLTTKSLPELRMQLELMPPAPTQNNIPGLPPILPSFVGAPGVVHNYQPQGELDQSDILVAPTLNSFSADDDDDNQYQQRRKRA